MTIHSSSEKVAGILSDEMIGHYRRDGFLHVPGMLNADEVRGYLAEAQAMFEREQMVSWDEAGGNVMDWVADVELRSDVMRRLVLHPRITAIAEALAGNALRLFKSELLLKRQQGATDTPMHIDDFAFPLEDAPNTLTVWVALVDVPVEKGCMTFLAGSHRLVSAGMASSEDAPPEASWEDMMMKPLQIWPDLNWSTRVTPPLRAGDCTFHHARTVHMAGTNQTGQPRYSLATVYTDAGARYAPGHIESYADDENMEGYLPQSMKGLQPGDPLPNSRFPKIRSG
ncbi:phytanoyl-CoA dioxygenase family protein [Natronospirillum operosum]|nr:phytanoyl-CoA dioxygenase family protein [Natronospirillum operosum]